MSGIRVSVQSRRLERQLGSIADALRDKWWQEYAATATLLLEREQRRHFAAQSGPNGEAWPDLAPVSLEIAAAQASDKVGGATKFTRRKNGGWTAKGKGRVITDLAGNEIGRDQKSARVRRSAGSRVLTDTGRLMRSVTSATGGDGSVRRTKRNVLEFGTRLVYAKLHQFGGTIPTTARQRGYLNRLLGRHWAPGSLTWPARPYLGVGAVGRDALKRAAMTRLRKVIREAAGA